MLNKFVKTCYLCGKAIFKKGGSIGISGIDPDTEEPYMISHPICKKCYERLDEEEKPI